MLSADLFDGRPMQVRVKVMTAAVSCRSDESRLSCLDFVGGVLCSSGKDASKAEGVIVAVVGVEGAELVAEVLRNFMLDGRLW